MEVKTTKILSITKGEVKKVYDIQVKKNHNFFANNLLVHNCIFQEQIALLAHELGKNIDLDEGNKLRKLLTKKGTGKGFEEKDKIHAKFIEGCIEKDISKGEAQRMWETFEYFSGYGFNKSHAVCYSILSFQCAWLLTYYKAEWFAAYLQKLTE
jgi:DNA polymerase-3 subunit alpha